MPLPHSLFLLVTTNREQTSSLSSVSASLFLFCLCIHLYHIFRFKGRKGRWAPLETAKTETDFPFRASRRECSPGHNWTLAKRDPRWASHRQSCACALSDSLQPPWTAAYQAALSMGFSRQECWSGVPCPPPGDPPNPGIKPESLTSPALQVDSLPAEP